MARFNQGRDDWREIKGIGRVGSMLDAIQRYHCPTANTSHQKSPTRESLMQLLEEPALGDRTHASSLKRNVIKSGKRTNGQHQNNRTKPTLSSTNAAPTPSTPPTPPTPLRGQSDDEDVNVGGKAEPKINKMARPSVPNQRETKSASAIKQQSAKEAMTGQKNESASSNEKENGGLTAQEGKLSRKNSFIDVLHPNGELDKADGDEVYELVIENCEEEDEYATKVLMTGRKQDVKTVLNSLIEKAAKHEVELWK